MSDLLPLLEETCTNIEMKCFFTFVQVSFNISDKFVKKKKKSVNVMLYVSS